MRDTDSRLQHRWNEQRKQGDAKPRSPVVRPSTNPARIGCNAPRRAASNPPEANTHALASPASNRCNNRIEAEVKKPLATIKRLAQAAPPTSSRTEPKRRIRTGVINAPSR
jgi:hypothetical protein